MNLTLKTILPERLAAHLKKGLFILLIVGITVMATIPAMLPGALANNIWSLRTLRWAFSEEDSPVPPGQPPPHHPHAALWLSRMALSEGTRPAVALPAEDDDAVLGQPAQTGGLGTVAGFGQMQEQDVRAQALYQAGQVEQALEIWASIGQRAALQRVAAEAGAFGIGSLAVQAYQALYQLDAQAFASPLARALRSEGHSDQAVDLLTGAIQTYPRSRSLPGWWALVGDIHRANGRWDAADMAYTQAQVADLAYQDAWIGLGWLAYQRDQDGAKASEIFQTAITLKPRDPSGYRAMASLKAQQGQDQAAIEWYQQAAQRAPTNPSYALDLANAHWDAGQAAEALAAYQRLVAQFPTYAPGYDRLAAAYQQQGQGEQALATVETLLGLMTAPNAAYYRRAIQLFEDHGQPGRAQDVFQAAVASYIEVIDLYPGFPEPHLQLAAFYEAFGQTEAAVESYQSALVVDPANPTASAALARLAEED